MSQVTISDTVNRVASAYGEIGPFWDEKLNFKHWRLLAGLHGARGVPPGWLPMLTPNNEPAGGAPSSLRRLV